MEGNSRRRLLTAGVAAVAALIGRALGAEPARAGTGDPILIDQPNAGAGGITTLSDGSLRLGGAATHFSVDNDTTLTPAISGRGGGIGFVDVPFPTGVFGAAKGANASGVRGNGPIGVSGGGARGVVGRGTTLGVQGHLGDTEAPASASKAGVYGVADVPTGSAFSRAGVVGDSRDGYGVIGLTKNGFAAVYGSSPGVAIVGSGEVGVQGRSGAMTGVMGVGGTNANPAGPAKTGVFGYAPTDSASTGVLGEVSIGKAVRGNATGAGTGVVAESHGGTALLARQWGPAGVGVRIEHGGTGHALDVYGRIRWNLVARTTIGIGSNNKSVSIPWVTSSMMVVATMQSYVPGVYLAAAVPKAGSIVFQLNKSTTAAVTIAYYVVG